METKINKEEARQNLIMSMCYINYTNINLNSTYILWLSLTTSLLISRKKYKIVYSNTFKTQIFLIHKYKKEKKSQ